MPGPRHPVTRLALALSATIAVAACGGAPASVAPATPVPSGTIALEAKEYAFTPASVTVPAGDVRFSVRNAGNEAHEFEVLQGETAVGTKVEMARGSTGNVTVSLAAGSYTFACRLNGHDILGMRGKLTVTN